MSIGQLAVDKTDEELKGHTLDSAFSILGEQGWELRLDGANHQDAATLSLVCVQEASGLIPPQVLPLKETKSPQESTVGLVFLPLTAKALIK